MGRIGVAFRAFFKVLGSSDVAERVAAALDAKSAPAIELKLESKAPEKSVPRQEPVKKAPLRSDAVNLLAALQREARLVDFIKEPIAAYSDAQIGAAVRDVHRDCGALLERVFALRPVTEGAEGAEVGVPQGAESACYRLVGNVSGQPPFRGKLCHHGWQATKVELPEWTGNEATSRVVAPAEVELK